LWVKGVKVVMAVTYGSVIVMLASFIFHQTKLPPPPSTSHEV
jgi:hypothetical protein